MQVFHEVAYKAHNRDHLVAGLDEFLDLVINKFLKLEMALITNVNDYYKYNDFLIPMIFKGDSVATWGVGSLHKN